MHNLPFFRRKLTHRLRSCAARRRQACAGDPTGEDLKVIVLLERLARDAEQLPQALVDEVAKRCVNQAFARRFDEVWDTLPDVVGVLLVPRTTVDLVRWMIEQARHDPEPDMPGPPNPAAPVSRTTEQPGRSVPAKDNVLVSVATNLTGALAVAGLMLGAREGVTAMGQWREQAFAASHLATPATVVSVATGDAGRSDGMPATETLAFTPVGERSPCRVPVRLSNRQPDVPGQVLAVVPRSGACEAPLIPATIGDPVTSAFVALASLAGGIVAFKVCAWLRRRQAWPRLDASSHAKPLSVAL